MSQKARLDIMSFPGFLIRRCNQIAMAIFLEETAAYDLTPAQYGALALIADEPGMDQTQLMERSALDRSSITKCVERLEARGAIKRTVDHADRRARHLFASQEGLALLQAVGECVQTSQQRLLEPLGEERSRLFLEMLTDLAKAHNTASRVPVREAAA
jgi:DNA-binding MarR family transcriptional regulator